MKELKYSRLSDGTIQCLENGKLYQNLEAMREDLKTDNYYLYKKLSENNNQECKFKIELRSMSR